MIAGYLAGFIAGEGCFTRKRHTGFVFVVSLAEVDAAMCELLRAFFGVGHVRTYPRRQPHYDDEVTYVVTKMRDLLDVIVPFMDEHLLPCHKRTQYEVWRDALIEHWELRARRRRPCSIEGCDRPRTTHGLCRRHAYVAGYG